MSIDKMCASLGLDPRYDRFEILGRKRKSKRQRKQERIAALKKEIAARLANAEANKPNETPVPSEEAVANPTANPATAPIPTEEKKSNAEVVEEAETQERAEKMDDSSGEDILGFSFKKLGKGIANVAAQTAAAQIEKQSGGAVKASSLMKGAKIVNAARGGNKKALDAIKDTKDKADGGDKDAKKDLATLKASQAVVDHGEKVAASTIRPAGLDSDSMYERGLAMIPLTTLAASTPEARKGRGHF